MSFLVFWLSGVIRRYQGEGIGMGRREARGATRVLIVDDHPLFRRGLRQVLALAPQYQVVAEASAVYEAIHATEVHQPDIALVDIHLPGVTGIELARLLRRQRPRLAVVMLSAQDDPTWLVEAARVGAAAYIAKTAPVDALLATLERVAAGEQPLAQALLANPAVARQVLRELQAVPACTAEPLTMREIEVLDCMAQGLSNKEIADALFITEQTVKNHITTVLRKLQASDRLEAILNAVQRRLVLFQPPAGEPGVSLSA